DVLKRGCWSRRASFGFASGADCSLDDAGAGNEFTLHYRGQDPIVVRSKLLGRHNMQNVAAAVLAAMEVGVAPAAAAAIAGEFRGVKRRLEQIGTPRGITVYDDFAHHPTAIAATLAALRNDVGAARVLCVLEPRSNTMRLGVHAAALADALSAADAVYLYADPALGWDADEALKPLGMKAHVHEHIDTLIAAVTVAAATGDHIVIMSNGAFAGIHPRLLSALQRGLA
ncbi:MAG: glutamate ligase domain-containing protein, partial [Gammaproteobacteria bacterium]